MASPVLVREISPAEHDVLGRLLVEVYSSLDGFPRPAEQPGYYEMLANIGQFTAKKDACVLVAVSPGNVMLGGVVYFGDMAQYGSGGIAPSIRDASGIRLLGVAPQSRGTGAGTALTVACIDKAKQSGHRQVVLHTTKAMQVAWRLYEKLGFARSEELDFLQEGFQVYGFSLKL